MGDRPTSTSRPKTASDGCIRRYFRIPRSQIAYVKFIVESYEGLAQVTSLARRDEMEWVVPASLVEPAARLADALASETGMTEIERPEDWPG